VTPEKTTRIVDELKPDTLGTSYKEEHDEEGHGEEEGG
jgi:hypothetical protein